MVLSTAHQSSPIRVRSVVSFVSSNFDLHSASVIALLYWIWYYIWFNYNTIDYVVKAHCCINVTANIYLTILFGFYLCLPGPWRQMVLTHWVQVTIKLSQHLFRQRLVAWPAPSHYLNQCWNIVNWTLGNKFQWNFHQNTAIFISRKCIWKCCLVNGGHFVSASMC